MAEYIEVTKILEYLDVMISALSFPLSESGEEVKAYVEGFKEARSVVERFPTVDVAPVRRGHWIEENGCQICSECGEEHEWDEYRAAYCDVCGAEMEADNG